MAVKNALRYVPPELHEALAPEFLDELRTRGRIYGYRFRPPGAIAARPVDEYGGILEARALQVKIDNNLDFAVALYPYELVTYGETGQVFQNWMQYRLVKRYLEQMTEDADPGGRLRPPGGPVPLATATRRGSSSPTASWWASSTTPRDFHAGRPAGGGQLRADDGRRLDVHRAAGHRARHLPHPAERRAAVPGHPARTQDLAGVLYVSSGLGGMSGAQPKAVDIAGAVSVIAEVDWSRIETRQDQGWVQRVTGRSRTRSFAWAAAARAARAPLSIAYHGNVVDLWQYVVDHDIPVELASDQTSCHAAYEGGYCRRGWASTQPAELLATDPAEYRRRVDASLRRQFELIEVMAGRGTHFWDYGNSLPQGGVRGRRDPRWPPTAATRKEGFVYPSYVEHIMGPLCFDLGYGPFRWVCLSGRPEDLARHRPGGHGLHRPGALLAGPRQLQLDPRRRARTGWWSAPRPASSTPTPRAGCASPWRFNELVRRGEIGPVMIGRDHHDVSGTDSPYRETANIRDGSNVMADMAFHCWAGNAARGMTLVVLSNGGGVGIGKAINGGFGLVLDGSRAGGRHHPLGRGVGRHGRGRPPRLGAQRARHGDGRRLERGPS